MRPILMKGHERSITYLKMNRDGDLLFSCGKDSVFSVWRSSDGVRLGTYEGHSGSIWCVDITHDSKYLFTASADSTVRVWETETGKCIKVLNVKTPCRYLELDEGNRRLAVVKDTFAEQSAQIYIYEIPEDKTQISDEPTIKTDNKNKAVKYCSLSWGFLNKYLVTGGSDGSIYIYNPENLELIKTIHIHDDRINYLCFNAEKTVFLTASSDNTSKLIDGETFEIIKTYTSDRNVNACAFSPDLEIIALGGGLEARDVTVTAANAGNFEVHFFNMVNQSELGKVKGHFGPINALVFNPDGRSFISGAEDGYIRLHFFDNDYFSLIQNHENELREIVKAGC